MKDLKKLLHRDNCWVSILFVAMLALVLYCCFTNREAFASADLDSGKKLVLFYTTSCPHCKNMMGEWQKAADNAPNKMVKIDATTDRTVAEKYNVSSYPTMLVIDNGKQVGVYDGARTSAEITKYVNSHIK